MTGRQLHLLDQLVDSYEAQGFDEESDVVQSDPKYRGIRDLLHQYKNEINAICSGDNHDVVIRKAEEVYAPILRKEYETSRSVKTDPS